MIRILPVRSGFGICPAASTQTRFVLGCVEVAIEVNCPAYILIAFGALNRSCANVEMPFAPSTPRVFSISNREYADFHRMNSMDEKPVREVSPNIPPQDFNSLLLYF